jgi:uncharacterized protein (DUF885 family)
MAAAASATLSLTFLTPKSLQRPDNPCLLLLNYPTPKLLCGQRAGTGAIEAHGVVEGREHRLHQIAFWRKLRFLFGHQMEHRVRFQTLRLIKTAEAVLLILFIILLASCSEEKAVAPQQPDSAPLHRSIDTVADEYLAAVLERYPEMGTLYSLPGVRHDRLYDNSPDALATWQRREDAWLQELDGIGAPQDVGSRDWVTYGILYESLSALIARRVCRIELWQASSATAWHTRKPAVFEIQPVDTADLQQQALDRLQRLAVFIDTEIANLRRGLALGYSAPRMTVVTVVAEVRALLADDSPLLSPAVRAEDPVFADDLRAVFDAEVAPAVERFAQFLETEYIPRAREEIGLGFNPDGAECYPALVRYFSTIEPSAEEIHQLGLDQIAGIRAEMQVLIDAHFEGETIESLLKNMNIDPQYTFRTEEDVLQYSLDALDRARVKMAEAFGLLPRAEVEIKPYPPYRESGTGEYHPSSEDGSRPGTYYIAVVDPEHRSRGIQQSVLYHETYPGHHLQGAISLELGNRVHPIARYFGNSGYGEGWALYSERLADELGLFSGPLDRMGLLSDQAARAARLVIDSGIHTMGWTRQQSLEYMLNNTAWAPVDVESEINRYIAWPGQANAYMLGMLEIRRLRDLAEAELGESFDLRAFHDRVLGDGSITLPMLDASITAWIQEQTLQ